MTDPKSRLDERGHEILDDTPVSLPLRFRRGENITQQVQRLVAGELSRMAENAGYESFEEANDFDVGDDYDPKSEHEIDTMQEDNYEQDRERYYEAKRNKGRPSRAPEAPQTGDREPEKDIQRGRSETEGGRTGTDDGQRPADRPK